MIEARLKIRGRGFPKGTGLALVKIGTFYLKYVVHVNRILKEYVFGENLGDINEIGFRLLLKIRLIKIDP
jgi:hypothetical protein